MKLDTAADQVFKLPPLRHQLECLLMSRDRKFFGLFHEMGLGKSKVLIDTASWLFSKGQISGLVIIAPKSACLTWALQQIPTHMPDSVKTEVVVWGGPSKGLEQKLASLTTSNPTRLATLVMNPDAVITDRGYDTLEKFLQTFSCLLTIDESTSIKNPKSSRTKILVKLGKLAKYRRIMSGTPIANNPLDIFSQAQFLDPDCLGYSSWFAFRNRYAVTQTQYLNGRRFEKIIGFQRLEELQRTISGFSHRALKRDALDLPEKIYETRYIELTLEQRKYYNELRDDALSELSSGTTVTAPLIITRVLRLRQCLSNLAPTAGGTEFISSKDPKLEAVLEILEQAGDQKVLIWSCFTPSILRLVEAINTEYGEGTAAGFYGDIGQNERQDLINGIQSKESSLKVLVLNPRTGSESITLTGASLVIYYSNDWSLAVRQQSEDRAHRIGQVRAVTYIDLTVKDTVDELIVDALQDKRQLADVVTGDALRGLLTT